MSSDDVDFEAIVEEIASAPAETWAILVARRLPPDLHAEALVALQTRVAIATHGSTPVTGDDRYDFRIMLDRGATAEVWEAYDTRLGREVAIKVFDADNRSVDHVLEEAKLACDVVSDHVVRVIDVRSDGPRPFMVMELVGERDDRHGDLVIGRSAAVTAPTDEAEAVRWIIEACLGVADAHRRHIFHRDMKPKNVLITPFTRRARVADFGTSVQVSRRAGAKDATLTIDLARGGKRLRIAGTPAYMAPEQAAGLPLSLDPRSMRDRDLLSRVDVYGLGAFAYELLVGRAPHEPGKDDSSIMVWERIIADDRPPALRSLPARFRRRVPTRLARIVEKAIAHHPSRRYASPVALADDLIAYQERRPTSFEKSWPRRGYLWASRNRSLSLAIATVAVLAVVVGASYLALRGLEHDKGELDRSVQDRQRELEELSEERARLVGERDNLQIERTQLADQIAALSSTVDDLREEEARLSNKHEDALDRERRKTADATKRANNESERADGAEEREKVAYDNVTKLTKENAKIDDELKRERVKRATAETDKTTAETATSTEREKRLDAERDLATEKEKRLDAERDLATEKEKRLDAERDLATEKGNTQRLENEKRDLNDEIRTLRARGPVDGAVADAAAVDAASGN